MASVTNPMAPSYVGISGAGPGLIPNYTETRYNDTTSTSGGRAGAGGILFPNSQVRIQDILDGTSNVMAISEQGDFIVQNGTTKVQWQAGSVYGFPMGCTGTDSSPPSYNTTGDNRTFNMTTILYGINKKSGPSAGATWNGVCNDSTRPGVCSGGNNIPLNSAHPGGVNIALCDGSVRFVSDTVPIDVLAQLATRDDNQPLPEY